MRGKYWILLIVGIALAGVGAGTLAFLGQDAPRTVAEVRQHTFAGKRAVSSARSDVGSTRSMGMASTRAASRDSGSIRRSGSSPSGLATVGQASSHEPGELLVADPPARFWESISSLGYRLIETNHLETLGMTVQRVRVPAGTQAVSGEDQLRRRFPALLVDQNHHFHTAKGEPFPASYARAMIGWQDIPSDCGHGVRVGVIDAGIDVGHPALAGMNLAYRSFHRSDRRPGPADHGTAIAGILIGNPDSGQGWGGLVPGAYLRAANVFEFNDQGKSIATAGALIRAVEWMAEGGIPVVNVSLAGPDNEIVRKVVSMARNWGMILIAAAGNGGSSAKPAYPAAYPEVVAVTAVGADRSIYQHANRGSYVEFAAPGVRIWTAVPEGGRFQSGTSFAVPYVSSLAALYIAQSGNQRLNDLRSTLRRGITDLGSPGRDDTFGWGLVTTRPTCRSKTNPA
ncbi:MAG: S8 family serine peptidase [Rhodospirillales bacterium]|nr:S8 family serine peptidase [Rhodospirillales bacterium]